MRLSHLQITNFTAPEQRIRQAVSCILRMQELARWKPMSSIGSRSYTAPDSFTFRHSADFRSVNVRGQSHTLTPNQASVIQMLYEAYQNGTPDLSQAYILERLGTNSDRLRDTFRSNSRAWKALVEPGGRKGTYRLRL